MKKWIALLLCLMTLAGAGGAMAKSSQMATDLPPWTEETVRQFVTDYVSGTCYDRLYTYLDLQVQRYMPLSYFKTILTDLLFMSGNYVRQGSYRCFENEEQQLKTHVIHLVMEKQDLDLYFTTKDKDNDWEIMALEFVPADREEGEEDAPKAELAFTEEEVTVGSEPYLLGGTLTLPTGASKEDPVPVCLLLQEDGAYDRDMSVANTKLFQDMAELFAGMGIATLRYDKRSYTYPEAELPSVEEDIIEDAVSALGVILKHKELDRNKIFVLGMGFGGMVAARAITESGVDCAGLLIAGGTATTKLEWDWEHNKGSLSEEEYEETQKLVRSLLNAKKDNTTGVSLFGKTDYYYWDLLQKDQATYIKKLKIPVCIIQSREDNEVSRNEGLVTYQTALGKKNSKVTWLEFRNLNHLLMKDLSTDENGVVTYENSKNLYTSAGQSIAEWILENCE